VSPGDDALRWDGRDDGGRLMAPGLYFAKLEAPSWAATRRIAMVP
jgi:hypothetical protein